MERVKHMLLILLVMFSLPLTAQERATATEYLFRFVPGEDAFYSPWGGNGKSLDSLLSVLSQNSELLREGKRYISVTSYRTTASDNTTASGNATAVRLAYLRCLRVKSELITRAGVTEAMFVTDRYIAAPYDDHLSNVVMVTFPASVDKVAEIAGAAAAAKVKAYNKGETESERLAAEQQAGAKRLATEQQAEAERLAAEKQAEAEHLAAEKQAEAKCLAVEKQAEAKRLAAEKDAEKDAEQKRTEHERLIAEQAKQKQAQAKHPPYTFAIRTNLLRWATLTPNLGLEWRINRNTGVLVSSSWTSWSWDDKNRRYATWEIAPEVHYYIGKEKRGYIGAIYKVGKFNYKLSKTGKQGDLMGGGITGGYQLTMNKAFSMDFNLGLGYIHADYDKYEVVDGVKVRKGKESKNWWGPVSAAVTLMWKLF